MSQPVYADPPSLCWCGHPASDHNGGDHCMGEMCACKIYREQGDGK